MSVSSHLSNSDIDIQPCQTISTRSVIKNSLSPYPEMKIIVSFIYIFSHTVKVLW